MYKSGFAHTENISQDSNIWTTGSVNGKACFYLDPDYCKTNAKVQNRRDFSYVISCVGSENAFFTKTLHVAAYTNYVVNVMVKSTFINESASTSDFSILPHYIKVTSGSSVIAASIDCVGISDDWSELSVGFYSGSNTTVTLKMGAVFGNSTKREAAYFSHIRVDTITPTKVLFLVYPSVYYPHSSGLYSGSYTPHSNYSVSDAANAMVNQFRNVLKLVTNGKVVADISVLVTSGGLGSLTVDDANYNVTLANIKENGQLFSNYDCVICNVPLAGTLHGRQTTFGAFCGVFDDTGLTTIDEYAPLSDGTGLIVFGRSFLQEFIDDEGGLRNMDGEIHEFVHYLQNCSRHLDKRIKKNYPYIEDFGTHTKDQYDNNVPLSRNNVSYTNYSNFYDHLFNQTGSGYTNYFAPFTAFDSPTQTFKLKYRWYYDVVNACAQDYYREHGSWGMLSNWVEIGCNAMTYHMPKSFGLKPGVYTLVNYASNQYLDSDLNSSSQITQSTVSYNTDQYWEFKPAAGGTFEIIPLADSSKRVTAVSSTAVTLSAAVSTSPPKQRWIVTCVTGSRYTIKSVQYGTYLSLANQSSSYMTLSSTVYPNGLSGWTFTNVNAVTEGLFKIVSLYSQKLASYNIGSDTLVTQNEYTYSPKQVWQVKSCLDGYLHLIPISNSESCLASPSNSTVSVQSNTGSDIQKWLIVSVGTNSYRIIPKAYPLKALDIQGPSQQNGALLHLWNYSSTANQMKWNMVLFHTKGSFVCRLKSVYSAKYMKDNDDVSVTYDIVQHSRLEDSSYSGGWTTFDSNHKYASNFVWEFRLQADGYYKITPLSLNYRRLTAVSGSANPRSLNLSPDRMTDDQKWVVFELANGTYRLSPKNNIDKAIDVRGPSQEENTGLQLWTFSDVSQQRWNIEGFDISFSNKRYNISFAKVPSKNLDARDDNSSATRIASIPRDDIATIYSPNGSNAQIWKFTLVDGYYEITPISKQTYRLSGIITQVGNPNAVRKKYADESEEQKWIVESVGGQYYRISPRDNPSKSLVLENVAGAGFNVEGNLVQLWTYNSTDQVKVKFVQVT